MIDQSVVTIVIPHLGTADEQLYALQECRKSLEETVPGIKRIIAVNGNPKPIQYNEYPDHETWIHIKEQGQCKAVNVAVAMTNTPWVFITNDDMVYAPGWWEKLTKFTNPMALCVSPQLVEPRSGAPTFLVYFCGGAGGDFDKQKWLDYAVNYMQNEPWHDIRPGFNLPFLIRRELWDVIGGYDINYDPWGSNSDSDLEYKIRLAGVQPYQNTNSIVYHFSQTSGTFEPRNQSYWGKNFAYFQEKWGFPRTDKGIWEANFRMPTMDEERIFRPEWEARYGPVY